jgi:alkylation response protein AidB-like acyl-CoA dehydrogenase
MPLCSGAAACAVVAAARLRRAAWLAGLGTDCTAHAVGRARTRRQFGRALVENQSIAFGLARLAVRCQAVRVLVADLAAEAGAGADVGPAAAGALAEAAALALGATREAVQLHGAHGMTTGSPVERHYRTAPFAIAQDAGPDVLLMLAAGGGPA